MIIILSTIAPLICFCADKDKGELVSAFENSGAIFVLTGRPCKLNIRQAVDMLEYRDNLPMQGVGCWGVSLDGQIHTFVVYPKLFENDTPEVSSQYMPKMFFKPARIIDGKLEFIKGASSIE